jgi:hypothetical protein
MTTLFDVLARWGYSEIFDGTQAGNYNAPALRGRRQRGVAFDDLTPQERYTLASQCAWIRSALLVYFVGIEVFELASITRFQLGHLTVPPNVWRDSNGVFHPFSHYIVQPTNEPGDARLVQQPPLGYVAPTDALTMGYFGGRYFLIDGFHRAATFWRFGPAAGTLPVYKPQVPPPLPQVGPPF